MARLLVNPGTPQEWEIKLKPGPNRIGRNDENDFKVPHGSVSGSHCELILDDKGVLLRDLGSTNGTFINRAPVKEANLQSGQRLQLGAVDMMFESDAQAAVASVAPAAPGPMRIATPAPGASAPAPAPPIRLNIPTPAAPAAAAPPIPPPVSAPPPKPGGLRISTSAHAPAATRAPQAPPPIEEEAELATDESGTGGVAPVFVASAFCKFHPKTPARFICNKCHKYFCDMCVTARATSAGQIKTCRACGVAVTPVVVQSGGGGGESGEKGFFGKLPGTVVYPFKGTGVLILICATIVFAGLEMMSGGFSILLTIAAIGYLFCFMQNIIHATASDENDTLSLPGMDGLFSACFSLVGTVTISFGLAIGLLVAKFYEVDIPMAAIIAATIFGCLYFPMAFLAVAMKDTVMAANPLVVIPAILKMPLEYLVATILLMGVFGFRKLGDMLSSVAGHITLSTTDMKVLFMAIGYKAIWSLISMYLLIVTMRILGVLYITNKHKLGWFSR